MHAPLATVPPGDFANGFGIALGFIAFIVIVILVAFGIVSGTLKNPFAPLVRWIDRWLEHRLKVSEMKLEYKLRRETPGWTEFLEQRPGDDQKR